MTNPSNSPCTGICTLDSRLKQCVGCYRTLNEIGGWCRMDARDTEEVWSALPSRIEAYKAYVAENGFGTAIPEIIHPLPKKTG